MTKVTTIDEQFIYRSDDFGRAFWVDKYNDLQSAPLFVDNSVDFDNADYVSDWEDWDDVNHSELLNIYALVVNQRALLTVNEDKLIVEVI
tara:strand:- start:272 stop:541 length:270 start_codon:yes stop_codon:yes gene_type:complete